MGCPFRARLATLAQCCPKAQAVGGGWPERVAEFYIFIKRSSSGRQKEYNNFDLLLLFVALVRARPIGNFSLLNIATRTTQRIVKFIFYFLHTQRRTITTDGKFRARTQRQRVTTANTNTANTIARKLLSIAALPILLLLVITVLLTWTTVVFFDFVLPITRVHNRTQVRLVFLFSLLWSKNSARWNKNGSKRSNYLLSSEYTNRMVEELLLHHDELQATNRRILF